MPLSASVIAPHRTGSGPPVVLLHGIGKNRGMWEGLAPLAAHFTLLSYDFPGHGEAACMDGSYEIDDLSNQLAERLTLSGLVRVHVVGSSLGGMVAQHFAATLPERVNRLVLCDTTPALSEGLRDEKSSTHGDRAAREAMARADLMDLAEEIYATTLVLCADGADLAMREGADFLARSIPRGQLAFVPGAAVDGVTERPDWVTRVLLDFLAE